MAEKRAATRGSKGGFDLGSLLEGKKKGLLGGVASLIIGLVLGTTVGQDLLGTAGIPVSCVRALQRADTAIGAGQAVADDAEAALDAVTDLRIGDAGNLLGNIPDNASTLFGSAQKFNRSRKTCNEERD